MLTSASVEKANPAPLSPPKPSLSHTTSVTPPKPSTRPIHCRPLTRSPTIDALRNAVSSGWMPTINATTPAAMPVWMARNTPDR